MPTRKPDPTIPVPPPAPPPGPEPTPPLPAPVPPVVSPKPAPEPSPISPTTAPAVGQVEFLPAAPLPVSAATPFRALGDVDFDVWYDEADRLNSPFTVNQLTDCHDAAEPMTALVLHLGEWESTLGRSMVKPNNWLGLRIPGSLDFMSFDTPADCVRELIRRWTDPTYKPTDPGVYMPRELSLASFYKKYAPPNENPTVERIADAVADINRWRAGVVPAPPPPPPAPTFDVPFRVALIPAGNSNRPGRKLDAREYVTWHETGNPAPGATAEMHRNFVFTGGGPDNVSFHFAVDDKEAIQLLPLDEMGWHAGDGCDNHATDFGCFRSVAIETCVNLPVGHVGWEKAKDNLAKLTAEIIRNPGRFAGGTGANFALSRIRPHKAWSGKNCPTRMLAELEITVAGGGPLVVRVEQYLRGGSPVPGPVFPGLTIPTDVFLKIFPKATPGGLRTNWYLTRWVPRGEYPTMLGEATGSDGAAYTWFSGGQVLRYKDGVLSEVGPTGVD